ncbi:MAG: SOS response-associated peptidase [Clostridiales bacterium]|nr:SOS response-associated peptidase [Clostridiales bacterium]
MCARFFLDEDQEELLEIVAEMQRSPLSGRFLEAGHEVETSGEIRPTQVVPVIAPGKSRRKTVFPMKWGFRIRNGSLLINARSETAAQKPTFRSAWERHRCIIPASWYFEWDHSVDGSGRSRNKYRIRSRGASLTWLAGLYRIEDDLPVFTILTKDPTADLRQIHDRMPLILPKDRIEEWIRPDARPEELLPYAVSDLSVENAALQL